MEGMVGSDFILEIALWLPLERRLVRKAKPRGMGPVRRTHTRCAVDLGRRGNFRWLRFPI